MKGAIWTPITALGVHTLFFRKHIFELKFNDSKNRSSEVLATLQRPALECR